MEEWEYNYWLGYFMMESEETQSEMRKAKHGKT
jgi:hypothetical protein